MKRYLPVASRLLLGLAFVVFGLNGFLHFLPQPPPPEAAGPFLGGLFSTGYFIPLLKGTEIVAGAMLLAGVAVPVALVILAPILVNILAFHLFLAPAGTGMAIALIALELHLAWTYRAVFAPLFARQQRSVAADEPDRTGLARAL
jgi:uncharacterized membrane protein YphA (DoxX/SURF4 family)